MRITSRRRQGGRGCGVVFIGFFWARCGGVCGGKKKYCCGWCGLGLWLVLRSRLSGGSDATLITFPRALLHFGLVCSEQHTTSINGQLTTIFPALSTTFRSGTVYHIYPSLACRLPQLSHRTIRNIIQTSIPEGWP